ncbi:DUF4293 domain-containing protein [Sphingobacterium corticibacter]|uniref:DUF4293 domain-containing protein n=1 Tax=Sphingobacterium corticibacter TaxID=2171749 RepID=A0A2T8HKI0_9SPHI|nr:DUF4293 domain-containing protein [Sphingobacterium corticibacter]PVH25958.1 DUF4293 domain-containing protein [Sphingobacterium corticibacter]
MIQRIQSVWLLLSGLVLTTLFLFPYVNYIDLVGLGKQIYVSGIYTSVNNEAVKQESFILQSIVAVFIAVMPIVLIFLFKDRKRQVRFIYLQLVLIVLFAVWMYVSANNVLSANNQYLSANNIGIGFFLLPVSIIFLSMALGAIRNDEKLIKSADRLR